MIWKYLGFWYETKSFRNCQQDCWKKKKNQRRRPLSRNSVAASFFLRIRAVVLSPRRRLLPPPTESTYAGRHTVCTCRVSGEISVEIDDVSPGRHGPLGRRRLREKNEPTNPRNFSVSSSSLIYSPGFSYLTMSTRDKSYRATVCLHSSGKSGKVNLQLALFSSFFFVGSTKYSGTECWSSDDTVYACSAYNYFWGISSMCRNSIA